MPILLFCNLVYRCVPRKRKTDPQARRCFFMDFGHNYCSNCFKVMDVETGIVVYSRNVTWHQAWKPLIPPTPIVRARSSNSSSGTGMLEHVYILPPTVAAATLVATSAPAPVPTPAAPVTA